MPYKDSEYSTAKIYYYTNRETIFKTHDTMVPICVLPSIPNLWTTYNKKLSKHIIQYDDKKFSEEDFNISDLGSMITPVATLIESIMLQSDGTIKIKFYDMTNFFFDFLFSEYRLHRESGTSNVFLEKAFDYDDSQLYEVQRYIAPLFGDLQGPEEALLATPVLMPVRDFNELCNTINNRLRELNKKAGYEKYDYLDSEYFSDVYSEYDYTKENFKNSNRVHELVLDKSMTVEFFNDEDTIWNENGRMNYPIKNIRIGIQNYYENFIIPGFGEDDYNSATSTEIVLYPFEDLYYLTSPDDVESPSTGSSVDCCDDILSKIDELKESINNNTEDIKNTIKEGGQGGGLDDETKCKINRIDASIISLRNMLR